ncbi:hypothetical protein PF011_g21932 [Phytophthora fragariae]|uniref:Uncharacterized protein n=1 Tax=Phytophthora fragariae TaxID=53985 RepID=A0A6A3IEY1_9STRA|nr:hypothetical protein PF011_g21932 [Phytophthora fragariae]
MSRPPTRPGSRSLASATARALRSLGCTGESALDVLADATQPQPRLPTGASTTESHPRGDAPPTASRPGHAPPAAPESSVEHPPPPASILGPYPASTEALQSASAEVPGDSPYRSPPTSPLRANPLRRQLPRLLRRWQLAGRRSGLWLPGQWSLHPQRVRPSLSRQY